MLSNFELDQLVEFRRELHQYPEVSGEEAETAKRAKAFLEQFSPDQIIDDLSYHSFIAIYESDGYDAKNPNGPTLLFRTELDALPIYELTKDIDYISKNEGCAHSCGHDGHMAMVASLAVDLHKNRPQTGRVILAFQSAEETGMGAKPMAAAMKAKDIHVDYSFAIHNMPKEKMHDIFIKNGIMNCASVGMQIDFEGRTSHASHPEDGNSPVYAMTYILEQIKELNEALSEIEAYSAVTITHANLGEATFGVSPAAGKIMLTLRSEDDEVIDQIKHDLTMLTQSEAENFELEHKILYFEGFDASINHEDTTAIIEKAVNGEDLNPQWLDQAWRASEDFGQFSNISKSAMLRLGSGVDQPQLHNPDFNFPDELIPTGHKIFKRIIDDMLNG